MKNNRKTSSSKRGGKGSGAAPSLLKRINPDAAGIDCGSQSHYVAVPVERDSDSVREFATFTQDLYNLADWLEKCGIKTVAMESTGVYWIPIFEILENRGLDVVLVNARDVKNVPGRKTDVVDSRWIQELHSVGLLRGSFRPEGEIAALRAYLRHREKLVQGAATHVQRMQKALVQMNLLLHNVISNLTGVTGMQILRDILAGVRDPHALAEHRDYRCKATKDTIAASLTGNYRPEHLFSLRQNFEAYEFLQRQIEDCDRAIETHLQSITAQHDQPRIPLPKPRTKRQPKGNEPRFEIRPLLYRLTGCDLSQIDAIGPYTALQLIGEIGTDMNRWRTEKHFASWLGLAPNNKVSGGKLLSSKTPTNANRASTLLRMSAMSLGRTATALGAFYRRLAYRVGKAKAITATARKLAILVYRVLQGEIEYLDPGESAYDEQHRARTLRNLRKRANHLGFALVNLDSGEVLEGSVS